MPGNYDMILIDIFNATTLHVMGSNFLSTLPFNCSTEESPMSHWQVTGKLLVSHCKVHFGSCRFMCTQKGSTCRQRYQTQLKLTDANAKDSLYFILRGLGLPLTGESFGTPRWLHLLRRNHRWDAQSVICLWHSVTSSDLPPWMLVIEYTNTIYFWCDLTCTLSMICFSYTTCVRDNRIKYIISNIYPCLIRLMLWSESVYLHGFFMPRLQVYALQLFCVPEFGPFEGNQGSVGSAIIWSIIHHVFRATCFRMWCLRQKQPRETGYNIETFFWNASCSSVWGFHAR